jgi:type IV pilus assembly protein PilE
MRNEAKRVARTGAGFTLIEVMITMVILALVATIAVPSYQGYLFESRRADAKSALLGAAQALERCYSLYNAYNAGACAAASDLTTGLASADGYYNVSAATLSASAFRLTAVPAAGGPQSRDSECASFFLEDTGAQTASGPDCW